MPDKRPIRLYVLFLLFWAITAPTACADPVPSEEEKVIFKVSIRVDLGLDLGQNFGSLFEAADEQGNVVAGAGFLGVHNTEARSDRRNLHFFIKPQQTDHAPVVERLPRPNADGGTYLHDFNNRIFTRGRAGRKDHRLRYWDKGGGQWVVDDTTVPFSIHIGDGVLTRTSNQITYKDQPVFELGPGQGSIGETYYANGIFVFRHYDFKKTPWINNLVACPWTPDQNAKIDPEQGHVLKLRTDNEFAYGCGQLGRSVLITTNTGGVYEFGGGNWNVHLEPDQETSFQIYSAINYYDRLLFGQYPTGELYEFDGKELRLRKGWPPVMEGVSTQAREAQTTTIYGGDLHVGVWPWGEVWKYDRNRSEWIFVRRMFTHPELTDAVNHPYENEMRELEGVWNQWGHRVTSLLPHQNSLYISTSAKNSTPYEPKYDFLTEDDRWKEYGSVYRLTLPGHLSVYTEWKNGPTTFEFTLTNDRMSVSQDGRDLGSASIDPKLAAQIVPKDITWGYGVYGKFRGKIEQKTVAP